MHRQIIQHIIDTRLEINRAKMSGPPAPCRKFVKKCTPERIIDKNAVKVASDDGTIGRHGPFRSAIDLQEGTVTIRPAGAPHMDFITTDRCVWP